MTSTVVRGRRFFAAAIAFGLTASLLSSVAPTARAAEVEPAFMTGRSQVVVDPRSPLPANTFQSGGIILWPTPPNASGPSFTMNSGTGLAGEKPVSSPIPPGNYILEYRVEFVTTVGDSRFSEATQRFIFSSGRQPVTLRSGQTFDFGMLTAVRQRPHVSRVAGSDRYETSAKLMAEYPSGNPRAWVASGANFPDALAGAAMASFMGDSLLLTAPTALPTVTTRELSRLRPYAINVLGGTAAVSEDVADRLGRYAPTVTRLGGADRYETAARVVRWERWSGARTIYIASGTDFPDALSGSATAAMTHSPLLLTAPNSLPDATRAELERRAPSRIVILGGTGAVSSTVAQQLRAYAPKVDRIAGADRYATSIAISRAHYPYHVQRVYLVTGANFADALSASAAASSYFSPVLLTPPTGLTPALKAELTRLNPERIVIVGGTGALTGALEKQLSTYLAALPY